MKYSDHAMLSVGQGVKVHEFIFSSGQNQDTKAEGDPSPGANQQPGLKQIFLLLFEVQKIGKMGKMGCELLARASYR